MRLLSVFCVIVWVISFPSIGLGKNQNQTGSVSFPATLDLVERAKLAINPLTSFADKQNNYAVWTQGNFQTNPIRMTRLVPLYGKFTEALPLMRAMSMSTLNMDVDRAWGNQLVQLFSSENPPEARGQENGSHLAAIGILTCTDPNGPWLEIGKRLVDCTIDYMIAKGPWKSFDPRGGFSAYEESCALQGLSQFYRQTGYNPAYVAAGKLAYHLTDHSKALGPEGEFLITHDSILGPARNFHASGNIMKALSEYLIISGDGRIGQKVLDCYRYARSVGEPIVGFFPEYIKDWPDTRKIYNAEGCCVADMVGTSLNLSISGMADLWDDLDRYIRNFFSEMQMLEDSWLIEYSSSFPLTKVYDNQYAENVPQKLVGDFPSWCSFNEFYSGLSYGISHCCLGDCARAIYHVWLNTVTFDEGTLRVNLLLNHEGRWATVKSMIPYKGCVEITPKQNCRVVVRIPEYTEPKDVTTLLNGKSVRVAMHGRLIHLGFMTAGSVVRLEFDMPIIKKQVTIGDRNYTLTLKGNVAVDCQPQGDRYPFFVHPEYLQEKVPEMTVNRTIPTRLPFLDGAIKVKKVRQ